MNENPYEREAIRNLQRYLRQISYNNEDMKTPPVDGIFGSDTRESLIDYQKSRSLEPTGTANRETWDRLYSEYLSNIEMNTPPQPIFIFDRNPADFSLTIGNESFQTATVQYLIRELFDDFEKYRNFEITGIYDSLTADAVKDFQELNGLPATGNVNIPTWNRMAIAYHRRQGEYKE